MRIEWRNSDSGDEGDTLLQVMEEGSLVIKAWPANVTLITDFLNEMADIHDHSRAEIGRKNPQDWGKLVLARSEDNGGILHVDPELYWDRVQHWFRSRG